MLAQVERPGVELVGAEEAAQLGYSLSLLGLTLLNVALKAMKRALAEMASGSHPAPAHRLSFEELYTEVGFREHYAWEERFGEGAPQPPLPPKPDEGGARSQTSGAEGGTEGGTAGDLAGGSSGGSRKRKARA